MKAIATLRTEHDAVLFVLDRAERAAAAAERGAPVPADILTDIREFFAVFVDGCHHSKEEAAVFPRLVVGGVDSGLIRRLETEHDAGRWLARDFARAVNAYRPGVAASGADVARATRAYAAMLRRHIADEDAHLFTMMARTLDTADADISAEFDRIELEHIGAGEHERLHAMIDTLDARIAPWLAQVPEQHGGADGTAATS
jgi:hemerythrin-like domain-containing protein